MAFPRIRSDSEVKRITNRLAEMTRLHPPNLMNNTIGGSTSRSHTAGVVGGVSQPATRGGTSGMDSNDDPLLPNEGTTRSPSRRATFLGSTLNSDLSATSPFPLVDTLGSTVPHPRSYKPWSPQRTSEKLTKFEQKQLVHTMHYRYVDKPLIDFAHIGSQTMRHAKNKLRITNTLHTNRSKTSERLPPISPSSSSSLSRPRYKIVTHEELVAALKKAHEPPRFQTLPIELWLTQDVVDWLDTISLSFDYSNLMWSNKILGENLLAYGHAEWTQCGIAVYADRRGLMKEASMRPRGKVSLSLYLSKIQSSARAALSRWAVFQIRKKYKYLLRVYDTENSYSYGLSTLMEVVKDKLNVCLLRKEYTPCVLRLCVSASSVSSPLLNLVTKMYTNTVIPRGRAAHIICKHLQYSAPKYKRWKAKEKARAQALEIERCFAADCSTKFCHAFIQRMRFHKKRCQERNRNLLKSVDVERHAAAVCIQRVARRRIARKKVMLLRSAMVEAVRSEDAAIRTNAATTMQKCFCAKTLKQKHVDTKRQARCDDVGIAIQKERTFVATFLAAFARGRMSAKLAGKQLGLQRRDRDVCLQPLELLAKLSVGGGDYIQAATEARSYKTTALRYLYRTTRTSLPIMNYILSCHHTYIIRDEKNPKYRLQFIANVLPRPVHLLCLLDIQNSEWRPNHLGFIADVVGKTTHLHFIQSTLGMTSETHPSAFEFICGGPNSSTAVLDALKGQEHHSSAVSFLTTVVAKGAATQGLSLMSHLLTLQQMTPNVLCLQRAVRRWKAQRAKAVLAKALEELRNAATAEEQKLYGAMILQATWKGFSTRRAPRRLNASEVIQRAFRQWKAFKEKERKQREAKQRQRDEAMAERYAAIQIQAVWRGTAARRTREELMREFRLVQVRARIHVGKAMLVVKEISQRKAIMLEHRTWHDGLVDKLVKGRLHPKEVTVKNHLRFMMDVWYSGVGSGQVVHMGLMEFLQGTRQYPNGALQCLVEVSSPGQALHTTLLYQLRDARSEVVPSCLQFIAKHGTATPAVDLILSLKGAEYFSRGPLEFIQTLNSPTTRPSALHVVNQCKRAASLFGLLHTYAGTLPCLDFITKGSFALPAQIPDKLAHASALTIQKAERQRQARVAANEARENRKAKRSEIVAHSESDAMEWVRRAVLWWREKVRIRTYVKERRLQRELEDVMIIQEYAAQRIQTVWRKSVSKKQENRK